MAERSLADDVLQPVLARIEPVDQSFIESARAWQARLTKPPGSLGRLEILACRLAAIQRSEQPRSRQRRIVIFAADHGVCEEGVSPYPPEVTGQMVANFVGGGAAINALAGVADADVVVVDVGVRFPVEPSIGADTRLVHRPVRPGSRNFLKQPAMSGEELAASLRAGMEQAQIASEEEVVLAGMGEMGIGNTTAASALTAGLTGHSAEAVTGRGTGIDDAGWLRKVGVVQRALEKHRSTAASPLELLGAVGGLEIAALVGFALEAAAQRIAIVVDGFISTAAFAVAASLCPAVKHYAFCAHRSVEPGHTALMDLLGMQPLLDLNMRLGEGTGAALAMPILAAAVAAHTNMATFDSAGVSERGSDPQ